jgi:hypothetical protein
MTRPFVQIVIASALILVAGCATTSRIPPFDPPAMAPYKNLALVQTNANELFFVTFRRYPQAVASGPLTSGNSRTALGGGSLVTGNSVGATIASSILSTLMSDAMYGRWVRNTQAFNDALSKEMKSEMDQRSYAQLSSRLAGRGKGATKLTIDADPALFYYPPEPVTKAFAESVRKQCAACDAALVVNAGYGFQHVAYVGMRAQAEADVLLISLADGVIQARSAVVFTDTKNKYDYPYDAELLQDIARAGKWIPLTVEPVTNLILTDGK